jgi:type I restriction-modification system DNA methylase subunit
MILNKFHKFLNKLGFTEKDLSDARANLFSYSLSNTPKLEISYFHVSTSTDIFNIHRILWNENKIETFIAIDDDSSYVINAKTKPNSKKPLSGKIISFDYGVNSEGFDIESIQEITKDYIDSTYFFDFVIKNKKKGTEVDKDLLLNLITLRNKLIHENNDDVIHRLILRCLFFKYLEDRKIFSENYLVNTLQTGQPSELIKIFNEVAKINGDVFKYENLIESDIDPSYLTELLAFFSSDYRTGQLSLFPYQFDKIPVQLISHVYEAFLQSDEKKGKGIYYTPAFVVNFMLDQSLKPILVENSNISVLDPAVGSGAFLVESFKAIINSYSTKPHYDKKKEILQNQLFGIDIDPKALQIAAFSLYLALLEDEDAEFIREKIKYSYPILPPLIGSNLLCANAITDKVFENKKFDCILSNPLGGRLSLVKMMIPSRNETQ